MIFDLGYAIPTVLVDDAIRVLDQLPIKDHVYGQPYPTGDSPFWMRYVQRAELLGDISFTRSTNLITDAHFIALIDECERYLKLLLEPQFPVIRHRIHIIKTHGVIAPHVDEGGRKSCVNIGLRNASSAITRVNRDGSPTKLGRDVIDLRLEDGQACLLNTASMHAVYGDREISRYAMTYGMPDDYADVLRHIMT